MWAISRVGDESRGEEGLVSVVTRQRAPGQVQALHVTGTGDRSVAKNLEDISTGCPKKTDFCRIEHLQILLAVGEKYLRF